MSRKKLLALVLGVVALLAAVPLVWWLLLEPYDSHPGLSSDPADVGGEVRVLSRDWPIAREALGERPKLEFEYRVGDEGLAAGSKLLVSLGHVLPTDQRIYTPFSLTTASVFFFDIELLKDAHVTVKSGAVATVKEPSAAAQFSKLFNYIKYKRSEGGRAKTDNLMRWMDNDFALEVSFPTALEAGDVVEVELGHTQGLVPPPREAEWQVVVRVDGDANGTFGLVEDLPSFRARARRVHEVVLVAPSTMRVDETARIVARPQDDYFLPNLVKVQSGSLTLQPTPGLEHPSSVAWSAKTGPHAPWAASLAQLEVTARAEGVYRLEGSAKINGVELRVRSNPIVVANEGYRTYFGDTHLHSILSYDADRPPDWVHWRQRNQERHDFAFLSDHDMIGFPGFVARDGIEGRTQSEWKYIIELADRWYEPGTFVTLRAHEWTSYFYGHRNVYYAPNEPRPELVHHNRRSKEGPEDSQTPGELRERLEGKDYLVIPHSTAWPTASTLYHWGPGPGRFGDPSLWPQQAIVELYSTHGTSEYFDNEYAVDKGHPEIPTDSAITKKLMNYEIEQAPQDSGNFARDALAAGWKFGFVGSSDMHFLSHVDQAYKYGFAAVLADELTRESIWEALKARRTYATTGVRIHLRFSANDVPMGGEVPAGDLALKGSVVGTGPLDHVEIVKFDGQTWTTPLSEQPAGESHDFALQEPATPGTLYYAVVRQKDGNYAWSSPIWVVRP